MPVNILETVQETLGYPPLQKIDPNTQQAVPGDGITAENRFAQAAIPAILTGLFQYVQADAGARDFLQGENSPNWVNKIFGANQQEAVKKISAYAGPSVHDPVEKLERIAGEAITQIKKQLPEDATGEDVKTFFNHQINHILLYLPAELNMGELLNDPTLDDKTHKMEGPLSSLMQKLGSAFSGQVSDEKMKE